MHPHGSPHSGSGTNEKKESGQWCRVYEKNRADGFCARTLARFVAMPKKQAIRLWRRAREFDRQSHEPGRHGGAVGRTALAVLHSLVFDFLNHRTGRLDPSYAAIARKAGVCVHTVSDALKRLRELGLLHRIRRCVEDWQDGQFRLRQETNAYLLLPESHWRGWRPPAEPPAPVKGTWGDPPAVLTGVALAAVETDPVAKVAAALIERWRVLEQAS